MPRRSPRLSRHYLRDDAASSSSSSSSGSRGSSPMADQHTAFKDSPVRTLQRKSSSGKRLSPASHLVPHSTSSVPRSTDQRDSDASWSGDQLVRRRRDTGNAESSAIYALSQEKVTYDSYGSSSGYSSEDDCAGYTFHAASHVGTLLWMAITFAGGLCGLCYWRLSTFWYYLKTPICCLDTFMSNSFSNLKKLLLLLLALVFLSSLIFGTWSFHPTVFYCWAAKGSSKSEVVGESGDSPPYLKAEQLLLSKIHDLERRLEALESECSALWQKEATRLEGRELQQEKLESWVLQLTSEWQNLAQEALKEYLLKELDAQLAGIRQELAALFQTQAAEPEQFNLWPPKMAALLRDEVHLIVNSALKRYSEDRIGLVDYALESSGATVINTRCSETYDTRTTILSLFGIPLWYYSQSPRAILQPDVYPGNCWAFRGPQGSAVVRLSAYIHLTAVTLEHVPKALSPMSNIPSAPKDFVILGLSEDPQSEGVELGFFTYNNAGEPIQTFHVQGSGTDPYQVIELRILSNWGHPEYTCIYRFRAHGNPVN